MVSYCFDALSVRFCSKPLRRHVIVELFLAALARFVKALNFLRRGNITVIFTAVLNFIVKRTGTVYRNEITENMLPALVSKGETGLSNKK